MQERTSRIDPVDGRALPFRVYFADGFPGSARDKLQRHPGIKVSGQDGTSTQELEELLKRTGAEAINAIVVRSETKLKGEKFRHLLDQTSGLSLVVRAGIGTDNISDDIAAEKGRVVENTPEGNVDAVVAMTLSDIEYISSPQFEGQANLRERRWGKVGWSQHPEIYKGRTFGVVALGNIGYRVALAIKKRGGNVIGYDPYQKREDIQNVESPEELYRQSDVITFHPALNDTSRDMLGEAQFRVVKNGVIIINNARGGVVNEKALLKALNEGRVKAAKLDVFTVEKKPLVNDEELAKLSPEEQEHVKNVLRPLVDHPLVVVTPHSAANSAEAQTQNGDDTDRQIRMFAEGRGIRGGVNFPNVNLPLNGLPGVRNNTTYRCLTLNNNIPAVWSGVEQAIRRIHSGYNQERVSAEPSRDGKRAARVEEMSFLTPEGKIEALSHETAQQILAAMQQVPGVLGVHMVRVDRTEG